MEKILKLYAYVDGGANDTPFPDADNPIEIGAFRYDAKRMGGAPTITASVSYPTCLDDRWTDKVYALFNGEKYYLKQTPTSSYNNDDTRYKHDLELVSERVILDNVYFYDAVAQGEVPSDDKPVSNGTKFVFWGDIHQFKDRLNASLRYSGIDYVAVVDEDVTSEEKLVSFEDAFFSNAIQESYNTFDVPYYFTFNAETGQKEIHFGFTDNVIAKEFEYGVDNALLSITKSNANFKTVNRVTGIGSTDNIPFYYPNNSPKGEIKAECSNDALSVKVLDFEKFSNSVGIDDSVTYRNAACELSSVKATHSSFKSLDEWFSEGFYDAVKSINLTLKLNASSVGRKTVRVRVEAKNIRDGKDTLVEGADYSVQWALMTDTYGEPIETWMAREASSTVELAKEGANDVYLRCSIRFVDAKRAPLPSTLHRADLKISVSLEDNEGWEYKERMYGLEDFGLTIESGTPVSGDTITQRLVKYVKTSQNLMPSIYRETDGAERFYNAINGAYEGVEFPNPYVEGHPKEHIISVDDLKPTIKETVVNGLRIDMFSEFAYDVDDNDETYEDEEGNVFFKHPYFFGKLRRMDFNLFDHAIEQQPMVISFTSGNAGACSFEIGVTEEYPQKNPVQVDADGNLIYDENGMVLCGCEGTSQVISGYQESQQDTLNNEVWIALRKEEETYGILMPAVAHRPKACTEGENDGDTFVILGINLPKSYILNAEKKLEEEIIKYMRENNEEKFKFSISFSRIFFEESEENKRILESINENARLVIRYNGKPYTLYINSFSYQMSSGEILPQITVELDDELTIAQNALQQAINAVKSDVGRALGNLDVLGLSTPYFLRKDADDEANGKINFKKGVKFGEGGKVEILDNNSAKLTIEYLEVTKKATFTSLEIQERTHAGGQILLTPAAINCGEVEELEDAYRCYFQTKGADGDEIFNQFAIGDQAICQTFNAWGSKYYWRLVTGIGEDYIDLSKTDCDEGSDAPMEGDKIIQLGNREDVTRQNAIVLAAYGEGSPYIIQYKGIKGFDLNDDKITTKLSSTENIFTGKVHMELGSVIPEEVLGDLSGALSEAIEGLEFGKYNLLRNSGFTGDFVTESLDGMKVLDENSQMFSDPLRHWEVTDGVVRGNAQSQSGYECSLNNGSLKQEMMYSMIAGESYVFSFRGRGLSLTFSVGGVTKEITLGETQERYVEKFVATSDGKLFEITNASCAICELQLERGNVVSAWGHSMWDNESSIAKYQTLQYLMSALGEGSTDILGGLILSNLLLLGNPRKKDNTAGVSGIFNDETDVAFWGGGNFDQARATVMKYLDDPTYQPTEEEVANMAKAVITHGGRAILNDVILRGTIYATSGKFQGAIDIDAKAVDGRVVIDDNGFVYYGKDGEEQKPRVALGATCQAASGVFLAPNAEANFCTAAAMLAVGDDTHKAVHAQGDALVTGDLRINGNAEVSSMSVKELIPANGVDLAYMSIPTGRVMGLRTHIRRVSDTTVNLDNYDHTIVLTSSSKVTINLPSSDNFEVGQEYRILSPNSIAIDINVPLKSNAFSFAANTSYAGGSTVSFSAARRDMTIIFDGQTWWISHTNFS